MDHKDNVPTIPPLPSRIRNRGASTRTTPEIPPLPTSIRRTPTIPSTSTIHPPTIPPLPSSIRKKKITSGQLSTTSKNNQQDASSLQSSNTADTPIIPPLPTKIRQKYDKTKLNQTSQSSNSYSVHSSSPPSHSFTPPPPSTTTIITSLTTIPSPPPPPSTIATLPSLTTSPPPPPPPPSAPLPSNATSPNQNIASNTPCTSTSTPARKSSESDKRNDLLGQIQKGFPLKPVGTSRQENNCSIASEIKGNPSSTSASNASSPSTSSASRSLSIQEELAKRPQLKKTPTRSSSESDMKNDFLGQIQKGFPLKPVDTSRQENNSPPPHDLLSALTKQLDKRRMTVGDEEEDTDKLDSDSECEWDIIEQL